MADVWLAYQERQRKGRGGASVTGYTQTHTHTHLPLLHYSAQSALNNSTNAPLKKKKKNSTLCRGEESVQFYV